MKNFKAQHRRWRITRSNLNLLMHYGFVDSKEEFIGQDIVLTVSLSLTYILLPRFSSLRTVSLADAQEAYVGCIYPGGWSCPFSRLA